MKKLYFKIYSKIVSLGLDKISHFFISAFITLVLSIFSVNLIISGLITFSLGILKEIIDKDLGGNFDLKDIKADILGIILAISIIIINTITI